MTQFEFPLVESIEHLKNLSGFEDTLRHHSDTVHNMKQSKARDEKSPDVLAAYSFVDIWSGLTGDLADV